ncbi:TIGR03621 family F420-dependent LLM class oxidoreductase [Gordonia aurantiaca]|uniref:TIGR03621 family F420-dependent LLM class oxidoreductase n=1 Tax=Gordonia sp. B21 TaxID=3151852 RepID=UPI0032634FFE
MSLASRAFRFGVNMLAVGDTESWRRRVRWVDELGYDVVLVPDHLGVPSPWPALAVAAQISDRLRVGPFVLNAAFTNPALLARDVATVDQLSDGRVEFGIGTGYARAEFESAGIEYLPPGRRVDHLADTVQKTMSFLSDPDFTPRPVQSRIPLLLGGNGDRLLRMAAERADIVGYTAAKTGRDGALAPLTAAEFGDRVAYARAAAGSRADVVEWNLLIQIVEVTDDPIAVAEEHIARWGLTIGPQEFCDLPSVLIGSVSDLAGRLVELRENTGIGYITVLEPVCEQFAPVIARLREIDGTP